MGVGEITPELAETEKDRGPGITSGANRYCKEKATSFLLCYNHLPVFPTDDKLFGFVDYSLLISE